MKKVNHSICVLLHNIRSVYNVGSLFRIADCAGIAEIYITGYTPAPIDRFGRARSDMAKVSLGAEKSVRWQYEKSPSKVIGKLKKQGFQIVALEQAVNSVDYKKFKITKPTLIILGNEPRGISKPLLGHADVVAEIPMRGDKESLNVSTAAGIFIFRILNI